MTTPCSESESESESESGSGSGTERDRGSGTVLMLGVVAVGLLLAMSLAMVAQARLGHARAQTAADLGALAAAESVARGHHSSACGRAAQVAVAHGAEVESCTVHAETAEVRVTVVVPGIGTARAAARAGPESAR